MNKKFIKENSPNVALRRSSSLQIMGKNNNNRETKIQTPIELKNLFDRPSSKNVSQIIKQRYEQLTKLEEEVNNIEYDNKIIAKNNNGNKVFLNKLKQKNEKLDFQMKGFKEKIISAQKMKNSLFNKLNEIKNKFEFSQRQFMIYIMMKENKIKTVMNNVHYILDSNEDEKNIFGRKIEDVLLNKINIETDLKNIKNKIYSIEKSLSVIEERKNSEKENILREKNKLEKFLNEL